MVVALIPEEYVGDWGSSTGYLSGVLQIQDGRAKDELIVQILSAIKVLGVLGGGAGGRGAERVDPFSIGAETT